ncbi:LAFE_0E08724g1_1 [Lachancea fermentati]|uniref:LAFE_0E08724g1_1 n=1 Tax=Lachancea fermentati TaxID=4955 RepID=A0A1G4MDJ9_LACFM|nr:LAFE_0E08724g1_1 [Lachancea fermentati]
MAFWWKKNPKTPSDYAKLLSEHLTKFETVSTTDSRRKAQDECGRYLSGIKQFILEDLDPVPPPEAIDELYATIYQSDLIYDLLVHLPELDFETRKDVAVVFAICLRRSKDNKFITVDYLVTRPKIIALMLRTTEVALKKPHCNDIFLNVGSMILESIKYEQLCRIILKDQQIWKFFEFARLGCFEISTESLQILTDTFTQHPKLVSTEFFNQPQNIQKFIERLNNLIAHGNYVTKRQSIKLLYNLIMIRPYNQLLNAYINSPENLKLIMILLSDRSRNLQLGSFNIFKVFIANPRKSKPVMDILVKNREKLLLYLENFNGDSKDSTFLDEKEYVMQEIESFPRLVSSNSDPFIESSPQKNISG